MKPEWRTAPVRSLMAALDDRKDYGLLPVLADALEEAGCDDPVVLDYLRTAAPPHAGPWYRRVVEGTAGAHDVVAAVDWLTEFGKTLLGYFYHDQPYVSEWSGETTTYGVRPAPLDQAFAWILGVCDEYVATATADADGDGDRFGFYGVDTPDEARAGYEEMWHRYEVLTGVTLWDADGDPPFPFYCSC